MLTRATARRVVQSQMAKGQIERLYLHRPRVPGKLRKPKRRMTIYVVTPAGARECATLAVGL